MQVGGFKSFQSSMDGPFDPEARAANEGNTPFDLQM